MKFRIGGISALNVLLAVALCAAPSCNREPEVGSPEWCEGEQADGKMDDYTMKEIMLYAQHCMQTGANASE